MAPTALSTITTTAALCDVFTAWTQAAGLPEGDAEDLIYSDLLTDGQRQWLTAFIRRWDDVQRAEDGRRW